MFLKHMERFYLALKNNFFWLLLALMVFIPLYPKFPLVPVAGTYISIRLEDLLIAILSAIWFAIKISQIKNILRQPIFRIIVIFWILGFLSYISAYYITFTINPSLGFLHLLRRVEYMVLFLMAATTISSSLQVKLILKSGLFVTALIVFYGFGQQFLNFPVISTTNREFSKGLILFLTPDARVNSTFAGHYDLAAYLSIVLVMLGGMFFYIKKPLEKALILIVGLFSFLLLGLTAARVSFVATLLGLIYSFFLSEQGATPKVRGLSSLKTKIVLIGFLIFASVSVVAIVPDLRHRFVATLTVNFLGGGGPKYTPPAGMVQKPGMRVSETSRAALLNQATKSGEDIATVASDIAPGEPINSTELGVYRSYGIRLDVEWPRAINAFLRNPLLGTGYSSISIATDNDILRSLGEVGLLGTSALVAIFYILLRRMYQFIKKSSGFERSFIVGVFCFLLALFVTSLFIDVFEASKIATITWFILGVAWAVVREYKDA